MSDTPWTDVCNEDDVFDDNAVGLQVAGRDIALYKVEGRVFATDNTCTHGRARLCDGFLEGYEIECPLHQATFDIRTGKAQCAPATKDLVTYPVKVEGDDVLVDA